MAAIGTLSNPLPHNLKKLSENIVRKGENAGRASIISFSHNDSDCIKGQISPTEQYSLFPANTSSLDQSIISLCS